MAKADDEPVSEHRVQPTATGRKLATDGHDDDDDDGERTRFPCLATVRSLLATVVTVLAAVVVILVILAVNRPDKIIVSIEDGYIESDKPWMRNSTEVKLSVDVTAYNPSGRGKAIECTIHAISILDMPHRSPLSGMWLIGSSNRTVNFSVPPQTYTQRKNVITINDNETLQYINRVYRYPSTFRAMVQVDLACSAKIGNISYYCWPAVVAYGSPTTTNDVIQLAHIGTATTHVMRLLPTANADVADVADTPDDSTPCKTSKEIGYMVSYLPHPPAQAPQDCVAC